MRKIMEYIDVNFNGKIKGIVHVGAHVCEEYGFYKHIGAKKILWFEPDNDFLNKASLEVKNDPSCYFVNKGVLDETKRVYLNVSSNEGASSSVLDLKDHRVHYPDISYVAKKEIECVSLDDFFKNNEYNLKAEEFNGIAIDTQGSELLVMKGGVNFLKYVDFIWCEINFKELYSGCPLAKDIDEFLFKNYSMTRKTTFINDTFAWGDAVYAR